MPLHRIRKEYTIQCIQISWSSCYCLHIIIKIFRDIISVKRNQLFLFAWSPSLSFWWYHIFLNQYEVFRSPHTSSVFVLVTFKHRFSQISEFNSRNVLRISITTSSGGTCSVGYAMNFPQYLIWFITVTNRNVCAMYRPLMEFHFKLEWAWCSRWFLW